MIKMIETMNVIRNIPLNVRKKRESKRVFTDELLTRARKAHEEISCYPANEYFDLAAKNRWIKKYEDVYQAITLHKGVRKYVVVQTFLNDFTGLEDIRKQRNIPFIESELQVCKALFDHVEGRALDLRQRECIVKDEINNLVVAGAGSGKTTTIVGKVKYLLMRQGYKPRELLVLSFTNASTAELKERIQKETGCPTDVMTFHKLGKEIIAAVEEKQPKLTDINLEEFIKDSIPLLLKEPYYMDLLNRYFLSYLEEYRSILDFSSQEEYKSYMTDRRIRTIKNEEVRSFEEMKIADFLYVNGIEYQIRPYYKQCTFRGRRCRYKPAFWLPEYDIYIEHFTIDKDGKGPLFFDGKEGVPARRKYRRNMNRIKKIHQKNKTVLIETFSFEQKDGVLLDNLKEKLWQKGVKFTPKSGEALWELIGTKDALNRFITLVSTFITHMKANEVSVRELTVKNNGSDPYQKKRNQMFLNIVAPLHYAYQEQLSINKTIDFNDMINRAATYVQEGKFTKVYKYIIVDEYQDISVPRYRLIKAIKEKCNAKLFCVGDDWQSIYRFAGSDIGLFVGFERFFGYAERSYIETTYRFNSHLAAVSSHFILKNKNQIVKRFNCAKDDDQPACVPVYSGHKGGLPLRLTEKLESIPPGSSVLLLGRYNDDINSFLKKGLTMKQKTLGNQDFILFDRRPDLNIEFMTVHKSKGLQADYVFVLNNGTGKFGFPGNMTDDKVMDLLINKSESYQYAEERRLFYVALTRAKKVVYLMIDNSKKSVFIKELEEDIAKMPGLRTKSHCPQCKIGILEPSTGPYGLFYQCSNHPFCDYARKR